MSNVDASVHNEMVEELPDSPLELAKMIDAAVGKLAALPLGLSADAEVLEAVEVLEGAWRRADGANAALLVEVSDRELFRTVGQTSIKRFYAQHHRLGNGEAKRRVEVAEAIGVFTSMTGDKLPPKREPIAAAVAQGEVSGDHVYEVEQIMTKIPRSRHRTRWRPRWRSWRRPPENWRRPICGLLASGCWRIWIPTAP